MGFKSYKTEVMVAMKLCKHEFCEGVATLAKAEVQPLVPVLTGNLKKSIATEIMPKDEGIYIGVTPEAKYGIYVEKGTSRQKAQPYLEPGVVNCIPKIVEVARKHYNHGLGGK